MTVEKYAFCRSTPLYRPALDTIVRGPDGTVAAFALAWLDPLTGASSSSRSASIRTTSAGGSAGPSAELRSGPRAVGGSEALIAAERVNPAAIGLYASLGLAVTARVAA